MSDMNTPELTPAAPRPRRPRPKVVSLTPAAAARVQEPELKALIASLDPSRGAPSP